MPDSGCTRGGAAGCWVGVGELRAPSGTGFKVSWGCQSIAFPVLGHLLLLARPVKSPQLPCARFETSGFCRGLMGNSSTTKPSIPTSSWEAVFLVSSPTSACAVHCLEDPVSRPRSPGPRTRQTRRPRRPRRPPAARPRTGAGPACARRKS